jgi:hypothetical protein
VCTDYFEKEFTTLTVEKAEANEQGFLWRTEFDELGPRLP